MSMYIEKVSKLFILKNIPSVLDSQPYLLVRDGSSLSEYLSLYLDVYLLMFHLLQNSQ